MFALSSFKKLHTTTLFILNRVFAKLKHIRRPSCVFDGHFYDFENDSSEGGKVYGEADAENGFSSSFCMRGLMKKSFEGLVYCPKTLINCAILSRSKGEDL